MAPHKTYSVLVGHLSKDVNKDDLRELFSGCGDVVDLLIVKNTKTDSSYGFIRYSELLMAQKAVSELNHWTLKGVPLVVSLAKDTVKKIAEEKLNSSYSVVKDQRQKYKRENSEITGLKSSKHVESVMYLSRLQENCTSLNLDLAKNGSTKGDPDVLETPNSTNDDDFPILKEEVESAKRALKNGKAAGVDKIPDELMKNGVNQ